eukprot:162621-Hanusia_phi.AAC.1
MRGDEVVESTGYTVHKDTGIQGDQDEDEATRSKGKSVAGDCKVAGKSRGRIGCVLRFVYLDQGVISRRNHPSFLQAPALIDGDLKKEVRGVGVVSMSAAG